LKFVDRANSSGSSRSRGASTRFASSESRPSSPPLFDSPWPPPKDFFFAFFFAFLLLPLLLAGSRASNMVVGRDAAPTASLPPTRRPAALSRAAPLLPHRVPREGARVGLWRSESCQPWVAVAPALRLPIRVRLLRVCQAGRDGFVRRR
jgi:hypothetical protein